MALRLITSGIGLIVFFAAFFANEVLFSLAVALVSLGMVYEAVAALGCKKTVTAASVAFGALFFSGAFYNLYGSGFFHIASEKIIFMTAWLGLGLVMYLILSIALFDKEDFKKIYSAFFLTVYITVFMTAVILLRKNVGRYAVIPVFLFSWITDTGAYFVGSFFGKHRLAPRLSPKKTLEGAAGGVAATVIGTVIYLAVIKYCFGITTNSAIFVAAAAVGAVLSEVGDLAASAIKRQCGIKDFGWIFPGHGGFLDRFDSVVFVAPYVLAVFTLLQIGH